MIQNGCAMPAGCSSVNSRVCKPSNTGGFVLSCIPRFQTGAASPCVSSWRAHQDAMPLLHHCTVSSPFLSGDQGSLLRTIPLLPSRCRTRMAPRASKDIPYSFRFPPMTKKPKWWWRTLACLPYLMPLHETWIEEKGMAAFLQISCGDGHVVGDCLAGHRTVSRWMPLAVYWGKVGMHFWTAVAFAYLFTVLESIRCALAGMYADIPFVCDAAYIQIPYE
ncbi:hypothetical protein GBA52_024493 [Prunus armeniaca]|nr:hypothetical protein GBA52_024493 [Prunus armeniaca]